jgi:hypothetical protein
MKCDSRASLLAHSFTSPCLGHEPKAKVVIIDVQRERVTNGEVMFEYCSMEDMVVDVLTKALSK